MATPSQSHLHSVRFPGESDAYRVARNDLLNAEIALRRNIEEVAALRRKLPVGGNRDYQGETAKRDQIPSLNVFVRRDGRIHHFYNTELLFAPKEPGQDGRHVDAIWPLWNMFDFTPEGRGDKWYPKLSYR